VACHIIALLVEALVELEMRRAMLDKSLTELPLYPEDRACPAPSAARVFELFSGLARQHVLDADGHHVQTFSPELEKLQCQIRKLLCIPTMRYR